jgi:hypothetical protein
MYYIHKLSTPALETKLASQQLKSFNADFLHQEFKTNSNTLSFWSVNNLNNINKSDSVKAILLAQGQFSSAAFVVLDKNDIAKNNLEIIESIGNTGYKGKSNLHRDLCNLKISTVFDLFEIYKDNVKKESYHFRITKSEMKKSILKLMKNNEIDYNHIQNTLIIAIFRDLLKTEKSFDEKSKYCRNLIFEVSKCKPYLLKELFEDFIKNKYDSQLFLDLIKTAFCGLSDDFRIEEGLFDITNDISQFNNKNIIDIINLMINLSKTQNNSDFLYLLEDLKNCDFQTFYNANLGVS